jgi:CRP-like cAMP-binding protein
MPNPLLMKLEQFAPLSLHEQEQVTELTCRRRATFPPRSDILREGDHAETIHIVIEGLAARYKNLPDGSRQITAFLIPGDICDLEVFVLGEMDHGIQAISHTVCAVVPAERIKELLTELTSLTRALWWSTMTDSAVLRERIVDHGRRDARERLAHLFCEMLTRYQVVGQAPGDTIPFPLTQEELADATGLTSVHVNRTLRMLRDERLVEIRRGELHILDAAKLKQVAEFDPTYLHLKNGRAEREHAAAAPLNA